jgi:hypothetical protein
MRLKLLIAVLVLTLSGANAGVASMCAAYCMSSESVGSAAIHHHQMASQPSPTSASHHFHSHHHASNCAECPADSANSLNEKSDCSSLVQIQALKEGSFSFDAPSGAAHVAVADTPADTLGLTGSGVRSLLFDASQTIRSFNTPPVPIRI